MKIPGPTQGSKIHCPSLISPNFDIIYSTVWGGVRTTPKSLLLNSIVNPHSYHFLYYYPHPLIKLYKTHTGFLKFLYLFYLHYHE